jgi:hypothetical protein
MVERQFNNSHILSNVVADTMWYNEAPHDTNTAFLNTKRSDN